MWLSECIDALGANLVGDDRRFDAVGIDTRSFPPGGLYVAIVGDRFDGHAFAAAAVEAGAIAILAGRRLALDVPQLVVADTRQALGRLARLWAERYRAATVALTGSNGKTTVKEMIARVLTGLGPTCVTHGNLNNEIGVPLTLFTLDGSHRYAVIEMGANHPGEIARLAAMTPMQVALVNNVGDAHLEGFGSRAGVAAAKSEIYSGLGDDGIAIVNADDAFADTLRRAAGPRRCLTFGRTEGVDVRLVDDSADKPFTVEVQGVSYALRLSQPGAHNRLNATAAVAASWALGADPAVAVAALDGFVGIGGRLMARPGVDGLDLIDDSYNANPTSTRAAIDVLAERTGERSLVLGAMAELGADAAGLHATIGSQAQASGIDRLFTFGDGAEPASAAHAAGRHFDDIDTLCEALLSVDARPHTVLVKGSRSAGMERVVAYLSAATEPGA